MRRYRPESKEFSEINITPFTDVVLVLLIIFMIAGPVIIKGSFDVKLPYSSSSGNIQNEKIAISLNIKKEISLNGKKVTEDELATLLKANLMNNINQDVLLNADFRLTHGWVVHIIDIVKSAGITKIMIGTTNQENY
ncbi:MAG TPA: biopolymer transporter ExbD [Ignavibacteriaceae bacterium]|nr:biopolymer transporter ExbD [Ignavibacteriaceae bacterium]